MMMTTTSTRAVNGCSDGDDRVADPEVRAAGPRLSDVDSSVKRVNGLGPKTAFLHGKEEVDDC